ncbi:MAG: TatD family hydrolase, partial [Patescibacteria group bacterium]
AYKEDMDDVIKRTLSSGVFMITVGTQQDTSRNGLEVASRYEGIWASVGLHPNHLTAQSFFDDSELPPQEQSTPKIKTRAEVFDSDYYRTLAKHPKCVAIGECGLDYYRIPENTDRYGVMQIQEAAVRAQFDLADELNLPVIIHCRDAYKEQYDILHEYIQAGKLTRRGVIHCYAGNLEEAKKFVSLGFFLGFNGIITYPPRKTDVLTDGLSTSQLVIREIPLESLLIETDAPYLTPVPHRGTRNEPALVKNVAQKLADIKNISLDEVERVTSENAKRLFGIE